jgi:hypothetical protein
MFFVQFSPSMYVCIYVYVYLFYICRSQYGYTLYGIAWMMSSAGRLYRQSISWHPVLFKNSKLSLDASARVLLYTGEALIINARWNSPTDSGEESRPRMLFNKNNTTSKQLHYETHRSMDKDIDSTPFYHNKINYWNSFPYSIKSIFNPLFCEFNTWPLQFSNNLNTVVNFLFGVKKKLLILARCRDSLSINHWLHDISPFP